MRFLWCTFLPADLQAPLYSIINLYFCYCIFTSGSEYFLNYNKSSISSRDSSSSQFLLKKIEYLILNYVIKNNKNILNHFAVKTEIPYFLTHICVYCFYRSINLMLEHVHLADFKLYIFIALEHNSH